MDDAEDDLISSETSDTGLDDFELELEDNFEDDLDSDEEDTSESPRTAGDSVETGHTSLIALGNVHSFHSCSFCASVEIDHRKSSQLHMWAKLPVRPSQAPDECEFFRFCKEQYTNFPGFSNLYMGIELNNRRPSFGCRVVFTFVPSPRIWTQKNFFAGRVHPSEFDKIRLYCSYLTYCFQGLAKGVVVSDQCFVKNHSQKCLRRHVLA